MTVRKNLAAARNVPWADTLLYFYQGGAFAPLTAINMQVRQYPGQTGAALAEAAAMDYADAAATDEELALAGVTGSWRVMHLYPEISEATLAGLPTGLNAPEAGEADAFDYDIVAEYADGAADRLFAGEFLVEPGVTD